MLIFSLHNLCVLHNIIGCFLFTTLLLYIPKGIYRKVELAGRMVELIFRA